jgi:hypothetical protein
MSTSTRPNTTAPRSNTTMPINSTINTRPNTTAPNTTAPNTTAPITTAPISTSPAPTILSPSPYYTMTTAPYTPTMDPDPTMPPTMPPTPAATPQMTAAYVPPQQEQGSDAPSGMQSSSSLTSGNAYVSVPSNVPNMAYSVPRYRPAFITSKDTPGEPAGYSELISFNFK